MLPTGHQTGHLSPTVAAGVLQVPQQHATLALLATGVVKACEDASDVPIPLPLSPAAENSIEVLALRNCSICSIVVSRASVMLITILAMINPHPSSSAISFAQAHSWVETRVLVQAHTTLDKPQTSRVQPPWAIMADRSRRQPP